MKQTIEFIDCHKKNWGDLQVQVSNKLCGFLRNGKSFKVSFEQSKTPKQLRAYWRLVGLITPYMQETYKGQINNTEDVSNFVKMQCEFYKEVKTRNGNMIIPKSLKIATTTQLKEMIEKLLFMCKFFDIEEYELTSQEEEDLEINNTRS